MYNILWEAGITQRVQWLGYELDNWSSITGKGRVFSLRPRVQTGSGAHPDSHSMSTGGSFHGDKAAWAWHLHLVPRLTMRGAIPPLPHTSSWRGAELSTGYMDFTFYNLSWLAVSESLYASPTIIRVM
jgi:hypothetical protein